MINPKTAKKQAKAAIDIKKHVLTQKAAISVSSSKATNPSNPSAITVAGDFNVINLYTNQIFAANPPNVKYEPRMPVHINPTDPTRYIPLTTAMVQQWAHAIVEGKAGVDVRTPPADFKFKKFSTSKKSKLQNLSTHWSPGPESDSDSASIINLKLNLLNKYLPFVKILASDREGIIAILTQNKATNPKLHNNVHKFEKFKSSE
ncbi:hypothetical protein PTTG_27660 [Puccinia triticina 1-1 BBBD Race 1]|uniref:Uncharacterized protein n=1 Tax=Puccinia triticina (isolate 1-1 / race 1 (BBBD)) TaxID=630390 RepID=A0A180GIA9_PUCT1|nr:hypothetical protein PTTG_27660 [Puccinia triticina 1-1 BBBD Race 1]